MRVTDRPGRYFALLVMAPVLVVISQRIKQKFKPESAILACFGTMLFVYELYWVTRTHAEITT